MKHSQNGFLCQSEQEMIEKIKLEKKIEELNKLFNKPINWEYFDKNWKDMKRIKN